ncbi:hypothetical protein C1646_819160 [Rhizophagus diaphanus]|nr:hypothetical protein C1646_819160 [Rhizophagus diaphanus] [Rhizophagus sp. MUCL 43196]
MEMLTRDVLTMDMIRAFFEKCKHLYNLCHCYHLIRKYLMGLQDNSLKRPILALSNELQRIRTEAEWGNDATSQSGTNRFSTTSYVSTIGHYSEYIDEYETYWIEFTAHLIIRGKEKVVLQHNFINQSRS